MFVQHELHLIPRFDTPNECRDRKDQCLYFRVQVSDIRSRFSGGGFSSDKSKTSSDSAGGRASQPASRHPSRGKEFSQLLHKFSSSSAEASSSERSDSDSTHRRRGQRGQADREAGGGNSSSDDAAQTLSARNTPERSHSLKVVRSAGHTAKGGGEAGKETDRHGVERSASFKSDFMKRRFSPVPQQSDAPSAELSSVLSRRHQEVERQQQHDDDNDDRRGDRRQARADHFKTSAIEEVIADSEVASVLRARRKETDSAVEEKDGREDVQTSSEVGFSTIDQSLAMLARVTDELQEDQQSPSVEIQQLQPSAGTAASSTHSDARRKNSRESLKEAEQFISDVETRISSSLHLTDTGSTDPGHTRAPTSKESSPVSYTISYSPPRVSQSAEHQTTHSNDAVVSLSLGAGGDSTDQQSSSNEKPVSFDAQSAAISVGTNNREESNEAAENTSVLSVSLKSQTEAANTTAPGLRRAQSLKQSECPKGILKRTPSLPKQEARPIVDSQLLRIMEQRRLKEQELEVAKEDGEAEEEPSATRLRALSAAEEIEENIR